MFFAGRLTRDPELKYLPSQSAVANFGVCSNRKYKDAQNNEHDEATFMDVIAFGKQAELINTHFRKGKEIYIEGRLKYDTWEDKQGGGKRSKVSIVCERIEFVGAATDVDRQERRSIPPKAGSGSPEFDEADIPF
jgi:single-strand DNA-binding protein